MCLIDEIEFMIESDTYMHDNEKYHYVSFCLLLSIKIVLHGYYNLENVLIVHQKGLGAWLHIGKKYFSYMTANLTENLSMTWPEKDPNWVDTNFCYTRIEHSALWFRPKCCPPLVHLWLPWLLHLNTPFPWCNIFFMI